MMKVLDNQLNVSSLSIKIGRSLLSRCMIGNPPRFEPDINSIVDGLKKNTGGISECEPQDGGMNGNISGCGNQNDSWENRYAGWNICMVSSR